MKGIARLVRSRNEGEKTILRFRIEVAKDRLVPVELRGVEIRGDLAEGDEVELPQDDCEEGDTGIQPSRVVNLTTSTIIVAWNPPLRRRVFKYANGIIAAAAALSGLLAGLIQLANGGTAQNIFPDGGESFLERNKILLGYILLLLVAVALGVVYRHRRRQPILPLLIAVGLGSLIGLLISYLYF
jgi:hypothetical protein